MEKDKHIRKKCMVRFKQFREQLKLSKDEFAAHLGLAGASYRKYERGETFPGPAILNILVKRFNLSLNWLICGNGTMFQKETAPSPVDIFASEAEMKELLAGMLATPLLRYEVLRYFHKFKVDNPAIIKTK